MLTLNEKNFFKNKKILIIGHSGFCGSWLTLIMSFLSKKIYGISLRPKKNQKLFHTFHIEKISKSYFIDICNYKKLNAKIKKINPDIIFHLASQSLVVDSYKNPLKTIMTNVIGNSNVLNICKNIKNLKSVIVVTSDKCYENKENKNFFIESDPMGGDDIYSASKACQEIVTKSFKINYFKNKRCSISTVRAGNIIGGGDWSENRLIPDFYRSFFFNKRLIIRNPRSVRPWQNILDVLSGYIKLAYKHYHNSNLQGAWNFGPLNKNQKSVYDILEILRKINSQNKNVKVKYLKPKIHESKFLNLNSKKSNIKLNWKPKFNLIENLKTTSKWYLLSNSEKLDFSKKQIRDYFKL